jgi:hypothetical protein
VLGVPLCQHQKHTAKVWPVHLQHFASQVLLKTKQKIKEEEVNKLKIFKEKERKKSTEEIISVGSASVSKCRKFPIFSEDHLLAPER